MKIVKLLISLVIALTLVFSTYALKETVTLDRCIDGDTARFFINEESFSVRFLAIDTPELNSDNPYGLVASEFTCRELHNAEIIELEADPNADDKDRYERLLRWIFVDGELLQLKLVERGYAEVAYLFGDYKYTDDLQTAEKQAEARSLGIWKNTPGETLKIIIVGLIIIAILVGSRSTFIRNLFKKAKK